MKNFKIYYDEKYSDVVADKNFISELGERINNDASLMNMAKKSNVDFAETVRKIVENKENDECAFTMIERAILDAPRYSYVKKVTYNDTQYDVEIDNLARTFYLLEI